MKCSIFVFSQIICKLYKSNSQSQAKLSKGLKAQHTHKTMDLFPLNFSLNYQIVSYKTEANFNVMFYIQSLQTLNYTVFAS